MAFSVSDFKTKGIRRGGARTALFAVELHFPAQISSSTNQSNFYIKGASIPASTIGSYGVFYHGKEIKVGGDRSYETWETTIINDEDFNIRHAIEKWMDFIANQKLNTRKRSFTTLNGNIQKEGDAAAYKKDIKVIQYNKNGTEGPHYHFRGAFPTNLSAITLDWASQEIQEFSCTWSYDSWDHERSHSTNASVETSPK